MFATIEVDGAELSLDPPSPHSDHRRGASESGESSPLVARTLFAFSNNNKQSDNNNSSKKEVSLFGETSSTTVRLDSGYLSAVRNTLGQTGSRYDSSKVTFSHSNLRNDYKKASSSSDKKRRRKKLNHRVSELEGRRRSSTSEKKDKAYASFEGDLADRGCVENLAKTPRTCEAVMERVPIHCNYLEPTIDDRDDPKSQVDRLIERGTLMYMDGENSGLSSEGESDDDDDSEFDSESDITDVSPLISSTSSPIGPSPVLPRRMTPTSPLALYDNSELSSFFRGKSHSLDMSSAETNFDSEKSINMDLLLQAVIELENKNNLQNGISTDDAPPCKTKRASSSPAAPIPVTSSSYVHPVRDNPHHLHLRKLHSRRKNMSFSNEEVRKIDRENRILLKKILEAHHRSASSSSPSSSSRVSHHKLSSHSSTNRRREDDKIRRENMILLRKIQDAKPSKDISDPLYSSSNIHRPSVRPVRPSTSGSCGASMLSLNSSATGLPHVSIPPSRKVTLTFLSIRPLVKRNKLISHTALCLVMTKISKSRIFLNSLLD